jgi:hypothetical protein
MNWRSPEVGGAFLLGMVLMLLLVTIAGCSVSWGREPPPPEPTVRLCLVQREITLRRGEVLRQVDLQPCIPAIGQFR